MRMSSGEQPFLVTEKQKNWEPESDKRDYYDPAEVNRKPALMNEVIQGDFVFSLFTLKSVNV